MPKVVFATLVAGFYANDSFGAAGPTLPEREVGWGLFPAILVEVDWGELGQLRSGRGGHVFLIKMMVEQF